MKRTALITMLAFSLATFVTACGDMSDESDSIATESSTVESDESERATTEPEPEPEPEVVEQSEPEGNETAFLTTIDMFRTSEDYPWMDEESLTFAEGDDLLVLMGYEVCDRIEALEEPVTMDAFETDANAYADEQGIWGPEAVSLYLAAEHLCPSAHEKLPNG